MLFVHALGHWGSRKPHEYCGKLVIEADSLADAASLAKVYSALFVDGKADSSRLALIAEFADTLIAHPEPATEAVGP